MEIDVENVNRTNCFNIIPNRFIWNKEIDIDFIINNSKDSKKYSYMQKKLRISEIINNIASGALKYRIIDKIRK